MISTWNKQDGELELSLVFASLLPKGSVAYETAGVASLETLYPDELRAIRNAEPRRAAEFAAGRLCARAAIRRLTGQSVAIPLNGDRSPIWPPGVIGSITHTCGYAAAAAAPLESIRALGIDAEKVDAVTSDLWSVIMTPSELAAMTRLAPTDQQRRAALTFSAKECIYKCQYPMTRTYLDFKQVSIDAEENRFRATIHDKTVCGLLNQSHIDGRFATINDLIVCASTIQIKSDPEYHTRSHVL